ncbi:MAG: ankyrin repeat domain-containing protein [Proteobacteria bacterium]|nr:ankyrin repeat domain-containing protein [Pseudomonadota bacterium]
MLDIKQNYGKHSKSAPYVSNQQVIDAVLSQDTFKLGLYANWGVNFNKIRDEYGDTLLHIAILNNKYISFNKLLDLGVYVDNVSFYDGSTPLNLAAMADTPKYIQPLLNHGANINSRDEFGFTPLNNSIFFENYNITQTLLKVPGIDVNIPAVDGADPIFFAFMDNRMDIVNSIVQHESFDLEFAMIMENDTEFYELKDYLFSLADNQDFPLLEAYQEAKEFALKYDFDECLTFKNMENHDFVCFSTAGYANRLASTAMADSFEQFYGNIVQPSFIPSWAQDVFVSVNEALHFNASIFEAGAYLNKIHMGECVIIHSGWDGHAITFVIQDNMLYRCNRGHLSDGIHGIEEFVITKPMNLTEQIIQKMIAGDGEPDYLQYDIIDILGLNKIGEIENPTQVVGNCPWTSLEAGVEASFVSQFLNYGLDNATAHSLAKDTFHIWEDFDLTFTLKEVITHPALFNDNEIFDDLLIYALSEHHDATNIADVQKGVVILNELSNPLVFETFDKFIGSDLIKYDPYSYQSISYMKPYAPATEPGYIDSAMNWMFPPKKPFSETQMLELKEYHDFLKACDSYRDTVADTVVNMVDILDVTNSKPLEALFNAAMGPSLGASQPKMDILAPLVSMISIEETVTQASVFA